MTENVFAFNARQFDKLFPFYILLNKNLQVTGAGKSLLKLFPDAVNLPFSSIFTISKPSVTFQSANDFILMDNQPVVLEATQGQKKLQLRGQFQFLTAQSEYLFAGSPLFNSADDVAAMQLSSADFANHDAVPGLLQQLKDKENVAEDLKELLKILYYKKEQQHLEQQEIKRLSLVASLNESGVIFFNSAGEIIWSNEAFSSFTGYVQDEIIGQNFWILGRGPLSVDEDSPRVLAGLQQGKTIDTEFIYYKKNGDLSWCKGKGQPIPDTGETGQRFFMILEDITEKKLSGQRLQESEKRLSSLISNLQAGILVEDQNRKIVLINPLFCQMFKIPALPELLVGTDYSKNLGQEKLLFKNPEKFAIDADNLLLQKKLVINDVLELADGRYVSRDYIPIYIEEVYHGHLWKYTDISAQMYAQQALVIREEKYRGIIANMKLGLVEVDNDEIIQFVNNSFCEMSGYSSAELTGNKTPTFFIEEGVSISTRKKRVSGIADAYETKITTKKGETKWWLISGAPRYNDNGEIVGAIGIHLDITAQKLMEVQLKAAKEVAENAQAAEQEFLANMSHEIRTPLNAIAGMTYLLQDTVVDKEQQEYLDVVQSSTDILLRLITNILDISKIEAGKIEASIKEIDIIHLLKGLEKTIRIQHKNSDVRIVFEYPKNQLHYVESDDLIITQILLNLLSNASKFTTTGEIKLQAELFSNHDDKVLLNVVISDTGKGMSPKEQHSIFKKFIQAGDDESRAKGTGLGLAITKKLVEFLKGTIHLESREGVGTSFTITIPMKTGCSGLSIAAPAQVIEQVHNMEGCKVLVAEDNEVNRKYIGKLLHKWRIQYKFAVNGAEAIEMLEEPGCFDIVLMDLQMPVMDGIKATQLIRNTSKWYKNIPVIGVSATAIMGLKQKARESGMDDFVSKPYTPAQLQTAMSRFLKINLLKKEEQITAAAGLFEFNDKLDTELLKELIDGDFEYAKVLFEIFVNTIVPQMEEVKKLYQQNDCVAFGRIIHKIKPTFPMVGIPGFEELLQYLETQSGSTNDLSQLAIPYFDFLARVELYLPIIQQERLRLEKYLDAVPSV